MFRIRNLIAYICIFSVAFLCIACGNESGVIEELEDDPNLVVVGFSQPGAESAWRVALTDSIKNSFTEERGYKLIYKDGRSKQDNQIKDIRTFIQQGVDYIILSPIVETGWDAVLQEAKLAGIPVVICDRNVVVSNESLYVAFVGSDFNAEGEKAIKYLEKKYDDESVPINILHIQGTMGSSAQMGRTHALEAAVEKHENWNIVYQECGDFTKAKAREIMQNWLQSNRTSDLDVIYCENDEEAMGVMACLNEANVNYGVGTDITIISFDATNSALELCMNGQINIEIECNPLLGPYVFNIVNTLEKGNPVPKIAYIEEKSFLQDDLSEDIIGSRKY